MKQYSKDWLVWQKCFQHVYRLQLLNSFMVHFHLLKVCIPINKKMYLHASYVYYVYLLTAFKHSALKPFNIFFLLRFLFLCSFCFMGYIQHICNPLCSNYIWSWKGTNGRNAETTATTGKFVKNTIYTLYPIDIDITEISKILLGPGAAMSGGSPHPGMAPVPSPIR